MDGWIEITNVYIVLSGGVRIYARTYVVYMERNELFQVLCYVLTARLMS